MPFERQDGVVDPLPVLRSLCVQVPEDEGIRGERDMDWHSNSFGKGSTLRSVIFLIRRASESRSNKLDSSNSTPIVHSRRSFDFPSRKGRRKRLEIPNPYCGRYYIVNLVEYFLTLVFIRLPRKFRLFDKISSTQTIRTAASTRSICKI